MIEKKILGPFKHGVVSEFKRADLEFYGINHFRPSYTVHVFFNDKRVDVKTCNESKESYAGRFSILGHPQCVGDDGHCDMPTDHRRFDDRPSHPLTPAFRRIIVTDALRKAAKSSDTLTITLLISSSGEAKKKNGKKLFDFVSAQLVTFE